MSARRKTSTFQRLLDAGDYVGALAAARGAGPTGAVSQDDLLLVVAGAAQARQRDAVAEAFPLIDLDALDVDATRRLAERLAGGGMGDAALQLFARLPSEDRDRFGMIELEARARAAAADWIGADAAFRRLTEKYPHAPKAWLMAARFHRSRRDPEREGECLWEALKFQLKDVVILQRLAILRAAAHEHRQSLALWKQLWRLDPAEAAHAVGVLRQLVRLKLFAQADIWIADHREPLAGHEEGAQLIQAVEARGAASPTTGE